MRWRVNARRYALQINSNLGGREGERREIAGVRKGEGAGGKRKGEES
jgi:hypothetical protein